MHGSRKSAGGSLGFLKFFYRGILGVVRKPGGSPFLMFYCIFMTKLYPPPSSCVHLWIVRTVLCKHDIRKDNLIQFRKNYCWCFPPFINVCYVSEGKASSSEYCIQSVEYYFWNDFYVKACKSYCWTLLVLCGEVVEKYQKSFKFWC